CRGLELRWAAGGATIRCDRCGVAQALDNLIVNAIEHGGAEILVEARISRRRLRISVTDSGQASQLPAPREAQRQLLERPIGRRRGYGLRVVSRTAAELGGDLRLPRTSRAT